MKQCPKCQIKYYDETLAFCLDDGSKLKKIDRINSETLTATSFKPKNEITQAETVQFNKPAEHNYPDLTGANIIVNKGSSLKKENFKRNAVHSTHKFLEISPIVLALAHNFWQWLYLYKEPVYEVSSFLISYNFLVWLFLLLSGLMFGIFSLKYSKSKGFAITALVVMAINVILSIVPK